jgi:ribosomal-protein-alanine N-acetyltransferase
VQEAAPAELRTPRLVLRRWQDSDKPPFAALNADPAVMEFIGAPLSADTSDAWVDRINATFESAGFGLWAVQVTDDAGTSDPLGFIGFVGLNAPSFDAPFTPCVEVGWRLAARSWGHGYATEGARAAITDGFRRLGLDEIVSFTTVSNLRSRRVMQRLGMSRDPADDFDHPRILQGNPLRQHVLYRLRRSDWPPPA